MKHFVSGFRINKSDDDVVNVNSARIFVMVSCLKGIVEVRVVVVVVKVLYPAYSIRKMKWVQVK